MSEGFQPYDEDLEIPDEILNRPAGKTNPTPDLDDQQYMEQLVLIAQAIAVMPGITDNHPNATTPPPIRPRWAKFLVAQGLRIDRSVATHKLVASGPRAAGAHGPQRIQAVGKIREGLKREDLFEMWRDMNPDSYQRVMKGVMTRDELWDKIPDDVKAAYDQAVKLAQEQSGDTP